MKRIKTRTKKSKFITFYENFSKNIKLGIIEDTPNRNRLAKLARWYSTKNIKELRSLDDYIKSMKPKQDSIFYLSGEDKEVMFKSPLIQKLKEKDIEVLLMDDPIDEFTVQSLSEYEKKKLKNVSKGGLNLWDDDEKEKQREKLIQKDFIVLVDWWKKVLGDQVDKVAVSNRLTDTPCVVLTSEHGYSSQMEKIQKAQAFSNHDKQTQTMLKSKKTLEINPSHPAIKSLRERVLSSEKVSADVEDTAFLLYESALLEAGFSPTDPHEFASRMDRILKFNLNLDRYAKVSPYEVQLEDEKVEEKSDLDNEAKKDEEEAPVKDDL